MENITKNWKKILDEVESEMMPASFNTWVEPLVPKSVDPETGIFTLMTYSDMSKSILQNRYSLDSGKCCSESLRCSTEDQLYSFRR